MRTKEQYRQGDVLVERVAVATIPETSKAIQPEDGRVILAHGEVTGHAHAIRAEDAQLFEAKGGKRFLRIVRETNLLHEEHAPIRLTPGVYRVRRQREYTPSELRPVAD